MGSTQGHKAHPHVFGKTDWTNSATRGFTSTRPTKSLRGLCMKSRPIRVSVTRNPWPVPQKPLRYPTCRHHNHRRRCHLCAGLPASVVAATVVATTLSAKVCAFCPPNRWSTCSTSCHSRRIRHREPPHSTHMSGPHAFPRRSGKNRRWSINSPSPHVARGKGKGCASGWSSC